jgi:1-acyl-sn-glycerol-3-phosphate acyltransferase
MNTIRAIIKFGGFVSLTLIVYLAMVLGRPLARDRRAYRKRVSRLGARAMARVFGMRMHVMGHPPPAPFYLVANHQGYTDIFLLAAQIDCRFVAKRELQRWPVMGRIMREMDTIFIDRDHRTDLTRANAAIAQALQQGDSVMLFPEGTSTDGQRLHPFRSSLLEVAAKQNIPIFCATIRYITPVGCPPASASVCWWDDQPFLQHLVRMLQLPGFEAHLTFGSDRVKATNRKQLATLLQQRVAKQLDMDQPATSPTLKYVASG